MTSCASNATRARPNAVSGGRGAPCLPPPPPGDERTNPPRQATRATLVGAGLEPLDAILRGATRGQHDDGRVVAGVAQLVAELEAALVGEHDVQDDERVTVRQEEPLGGLARGAGEVDLVALELEVELEAGREVLFVLDDQDAVGRIAHAARVLGGLGSVTRIVVPRPGPSEAASTRPPRLRTRAHTTNKPRPVPFRLRTVSADTR